MEFGYLLKSLIRGKWIIVSCVLTALIAAFVLTMGLKSKFKSTAQLSTGFTVSEEIKLSDEKFNVQQIDVKFNNAIENINSPRVRSLVSYKLMLHDLESAEPFTILPEKKKMLPEYAAVNKSRAIELLRAKLDSVLILSPLVPEEKKVIKFIELHQYDIGSILSNLQVARFQRTDYINIVYTSENQFMSAFVVNNICNEFKRFYGLDKKERTDVSIVALDSLVKQKKALLDEKIEAKNMFMTAGNVVDVNLEGSNKLTQIGALEINLMEERGLQRNYSYRVEEFNKLIAAEKSRKSDGANLTNTPSNNNEYLRLRQQYRDLSNEYVSKGSNDAALKARMDVILKTMSSLEIGESGNVNAETEKSISLDELIQRKIDAEALLKASNHKINSLQSKIAELNGGLTGIAAKGADIGQLNKQIELASSEYTDAYNRLNLAYSLNESSQTGFKQTLIGEPALKPEPSKRLVAMLLSGISSFFLSSFVIVGLAFFNKSIRTPSNFQRQLDLPLLGVVNHVKFNDANVLQKGTDGVTYDGDRDNTFKELLRKLRFELENSKKQIFLFTSTNPQQGKTSLIQALAYSLSLGKKRVLIIDTNFCNNDLTVAIKAEPVLEQFELSGGNFDREQVRELVTQTAVPGIDIIGCKGGDYTPSEILPKNHLLNYLEYLKSDYDFIFMEGAPLNGYTDTKELMRYAEKVVIIFSAESSLTAADKESIQFLRESDKFFGAILNKIQTDSLMA